jgi:hypothetical protein
MSKDERFKLGEFWLDRRSDGASDAWQITWYDARRRQTRQRSTRTADFELAQRRLAEHYIAQGERQQEPAANVLLEHVLMRYFETHAKKLPSEHFAAYAISHWRRFWGADTVDAINDDRLDEFKADLVKGEVHGAACIGRDCPARIAKRSNRRAPETGCVAWEMSPATIRRVLGVGRAAIKRAARKKELTGAPHIPGVKVRKKRLYRASLAEMAALLNASDGMPWLRKWIIGTIATVARPEAVLQLSRPQLDFESRLIDMNPPGRETTIKGRPIIPMVQVAHDNMGGDWTGLWITYRDKPLASIRMGFGRARRRAGLPSKITPYTVRRTISTELRRRGVPLEEIAGFLGHTEDEWEVTEDYAIYSPDYLGNVAQAIDAYCSELQPLLDFELLRTSCVPADEIKVSAEMEKLVINQSLGRLGLEPRTNTLKGYCSTN